MQIYTICTLTMSKGKCTQSSLTQYNPKFAPGARGLGYKRGGKKPFTVTGARWSQGATMGWNLHVSNSDAS